MTTFEHAMLGVMGTLAAGLHRRHGWQIAAMAGAAAMSADWDGATIFCGMATFDRAHRAWGHNLLLCSVIGSLLAALDYRFDLASRARSVAERILRHEQGSPLPRSAAQRSTRGYCVWIVVGVLASLSHLAADLVFSGAAALSDWELKLLWPFSDRGFIFPMIHWGDPGVTCIFVAGMFGLWWRRERVQWIAAVTLALAVLYILVRGYVVSPVGRQALLVVVLARLDCVFPRP